MKRKLQGCLPVRPSLDCLDDEALIQGKCYCYEMGGLRAAFFVQWLWRSIIQPMEAAMTSPL
ncbi:hypothetical protein ATY81_12445 [Rhizobium sp. R72]|nr:hypothetical protein ATY81_12445 [Rhizobium sp. R72]OWV94524.1 hypothetical protein ATY80_12445 [Rhizobium sp. R711]